MSLQVWLPLNGTLENKGLSDVTVTNNGATVNTSGKIGSCYSFDGNGYISGASPDFEGRSMSLWIKCDPASLTNNVICADYKSMLGFGFYTTYIVTTITNNTTCRQVYDKTLIPSNTWTHIVIVRDFTVPKMYLYINGVEQTPMSGKTDAWGSGMSDGFTIGARTNGANKFIGQINDLRIYDHCLSGKEVKELSKGLIGHWPLNDAIGGENLIKNTTITTTAMGWAKDGTSVTTITVSDGVTTFSNTESTALQYARMCQWIDDGAWSTVNGKTITVSFDIYSDDWDGVHEVNGANSGFAGFAIQICRSTAAPGSGSTQQQQYSFARLNDTTFWNVPTKENGKWIHFVSKPFLINEANLNRSATRTSGDYIHIGWQLRMQGVVKVKNLKVEYGSIATPWTPAPSDDLYSAMGLDDGIVYDTSGYGNNGVMVKGDGVGGSPRYNSCLSFDGSKAPAITIGTSNSLTAAFRGNRTVSYWVYPISHETSTGDSVLYGYDTSTSYKYGTGYANPSGFLHAYWANTETQYGGNAKLVLDEWNFIVVTWDQENNIVKMYVNAVDVGSSTSSDFSTGLPTENTIWYISGGEGGGQSRSSVHGYLSDLRVYITILSIDDIKELYNTSASVDSNGNWHCYEISEL